MDELLEYLFVTGQLDDIEDEEESVEEDNDE